MSDKNSYPRMLTTTARDGRGDLRVVPYRYPPGHVKAGALVIFYDVYSI
jgi:hypothetical protein